MRRTLFTLSGLLVLIFLLDQVYRFIYPQVDLIRACLVGLTALVVLWVIARLKPGLFNPYAGALAIFGSAFISVLLIQAGVLVSQTPASGVAHGLLLVAIYLVADYVDRKRPPAASDG